VYTGLLLLFALFLVLLNGMFVAAEFGFVKARRTRLELLAARGDKRARSALFGLSNLDAYLSVSQLGITLASLGLGWIGEPAVALLLRPVLALCSISNPALISSISVAVGFTLITLLHVIFGELIPKSVSIQKAEATVLLLARPMRLCYFLCFPLVLLMNALSGLFLRLLGFTQASEAEQSHSPEELRMLIVDSSKGGQLNEAEGHMLDNIFSFYQKTAKDIMLHRVDALALNLNAPQEEVLELIRKSGHSRFPVYEGNRDNIVGFVHARDVPRRESGTPLRAILRAPFYAHETMRLDALLRLMQAKRQQLCLVLDEYGTWQGLLTMEDMLEAIVGDIQDEFDNEEPEIVAQPDGSFLVSGDLSLDDLAEHLPLACQPDADMYKILAAHFMETLDRIPCEGDSISLCGSRFTVALMDRHRVRRVRVESEKAAGQAP
jgi:CBS domain containing-hemolysin-like protein